MTIVMCLSLLGSFLGRKGRNILFGLEQAQGALHGSVHPEVVHVAALA